MRYLFILTGRRCDRFLGAVTNMADEIDFPKLLLLLRRAAAKHLPCKVSRIEEYIQITALAASTDDRPCSMKDFAALLPYSDERIRQLIHKMAEDGWLIVKPSPVDGRVIQVLPSPALRLLYADLEKEVDAALKRYVEGSTAARGADARGTSAQTGL